MDSIGFFGIKFLNMSINDCTSFILDDPEAIVEFNPILNTYEIMNPTTAEIATVESRVTNV